MRSKCEGKNVAIKFLLKKESYCFVGICKFVFSDMPSLLPALEVILVIYRKSILFQYFK